MRHQRRGFTLVEVLVALTLIAVGMAAWVGTAAIALRVAGSAERESGAVLAARSTAQRIASQRCGPSGSGSDDATRWRVEHLANGTRRIRVERAFHLDRDTASAIAELVGVCR